MRLVPRILGLSAVVVALAVLFVWWNTPQQVDMATYAPGDAIVYLETNSLAEIANALGQTEAWKKLSPLAQSETSLPAPWLLKLIKWTGVGSIESVVAARAQVACVLLNVGATEEGSSLKVKGDIAVMIETHTSASRVRPLLLRTLEKMATGAYGKPEFQSKQVEGVEYLIWTDPAKSRQIAALIDGTLVIIGNSETALRACQDVRRGQRAKLSDNGELHKLRGRIASTNTLAFGFVPSANSARLMGFATTILLGHGSEQTIEKIVAGAAGKIVGTIGWSARANKGMIEDRYAFAVQPGALDRLRSDFKPPSSNGVEILLSPSSVYSLSVYNFAEPVAAWRSFESAILSQLDALSAVVFRTVINSALVPYGVEDPRAFLSVVGPQVMTVRLRQTSDRSIVVATVRDEAKLRELLSSRFRSRSNTSRGPIELLESSDQDSAAAFVAGYLIMGAVDDVLTCAEFVLRSRQSGGMRAGTAPIVTYTNDSDRVHGFVAAMARATGDASLPARASTLEQTISSLPHATTETRLTEEGFERLTISPLGQFSTVGTLLFPPD